MEGWKNSSKKNETEGTRENESDGPEEFFKFHIGNPNKV